MGKDIEQKDDVSHIAYRVNGAFGEDSAISGGKGGV